MEIEELRKAERKAMKFLGKTEKDYNKAWETYEKAQKAYLETLERLKAAYPQLVNTKQ